MAIIAALSVHYSNAGINVFQLYCSPISRNGLRLEIAGNSSGQTLTPGRRIAIRYESKPAISICMAGETVEIISLRYL